MGYNSLSEQRPSRSRGRHKQHTLKTTTTPRTNQTHIMGKVKYILLDCDNTLCQSERLAFEACAELTNEVLEKHGLPDRYDVDSLLEDFVGNNFRNMLVLLEKKHDFQMKQDEVDDFVSRELGKVTQKLSEKCVECQASLSSLNGRRARATQWLSSRPQLS